jgi:hypothetical protein
MDRLWKKVGWIVVLLLVGLAGCEDCVEVRTKKLSLPFTDNFNRSHLGKMWRSEMSGLWRIEYNSKKGEGRLCVENARNNPLFLKGRLPRNVIVEFDAWALSDEGDVKIELFTDGRYHATGYVLIHGGWHNKVSIIDRLDEHNKNRKRRRGGPAKKRRYHWKVVRHGKTVYWYLNGGKTPYMTYKDPQPLEGRGHEFFAFSNWHAYVCFDNLRIRRWTPPPPVATRRPAPVRRRPAPTPPRTVAPVADPLPPPPPTPAYQPPPEQPTVAQPQQVRPSHRRRKKRPLRLRIMRPRLLRPNLQQPHIIRRPRVLRLEREKRAAFRATPKQR